MSSPVRQPLSVTVITLNAGESLRACLQSVRFADEIVVLDSGSTDQTVQIAVSCGARVEQHAWLGFGRQKQRAVELATHDWVLAIDADEQVSDALQASITATLAAPRHHVYAMARCNRFLGRWLRHGEGYPDWNTRLFDRRHARWSDDAVHERVVTSSEPGRLQGDLLHDSAQTLEHYLAKQDRYTTLAARQIVEAGRRVTLVQLVLSPLVRFARFYLVRGGFLDGTPGLIHIAIGCWTSFLKYAKAWALQRTASR